MALAGEQVDAEDIAALQTFYVIKSGDEAVTSASLQSDDDLLASLDVGVWEVDLHLSVTGSVDTADITQTWSTTGTMTCLQRQVQGPSSGMTSALGASLPRLQGSINLTSSIVFGVDGTNSSYVREHLVMDVDVAGTLQFRFANNSGAGSTTVKSGSHLTWRLLAAG